MNDEVHTYHIMISIVFVHFNISMYVTAKLMMRHNCNHDDKISFNTCIKIQSVFILFIMDVDSSNVTGIA